MPGTWPFNLTRDSRKPPSMCYSGLSTDTTLRPTCSGSRPPCPVACCPLCPAAVQSRQRYTGAGAGRAPPRFCGCQHPCTVLGLALVPFGRHASSLWLVLGSRLRSLCSALWSCCLTTRQRLCISALRAPPACSSCARDLFYCLTPLVQAGCHLLRNLLKVH